MQLWVGISAVLACVSVLTVDVRSPSTKDGQRLELLYYAFDGAGPDEPQGDGSALHGGKEGKPGRVVEIRLATSSL
jgi:hypothetical protein